MRSVNCAGRVAVLALALVAASPSGAEEPAEVPVALRPVVLGIELGWNGLAGFGAIGSWRPNQSLAVDGGVGIGWVAPKAGVRIRYIANHWPTAGTIGAGLQFQPAWHGQIAEAPGPIPFGTASTEVRVSPTALLQLVVGLQRRTDVYDLTLLFGWTQVVAGHRVRSAAPLNADQQQWLDVSGVVVALTIGWGVGGR
jgi:hypothetical protein